MPFEVVEYEWDQPFAIFTAHTCKLKKVHKVHSFDIFKDAQKLVYGLNLSMATVDAPEWPMEIYHVTKRFRKLKYSQHIGR